MSLDPSTVNLASSAIQDTHFTTSPRINPPHTIPHQEDPNPYPRQHHSRTPSISSSILRPPPFRPRPQHPPLPDLRFEQSYLASIANAESWGMVLYVTVKDQVLMPLLQGVVFNLAMFGWRRWNAGVRMRGKGWGVAVRRWWWGVNGWRVPG